MTNLAPVDTNGCALFAVRASMRASVRANPSAHARAIPVRATRLGFRTGLLRLRPGVLLACGVAGVAEIVSPMLCAMGLGAGAMVVSMLLGICLAQCRSMSAATLPGLDFACRPMLRLAIVLLGLRISLPQVAAVGAAGLLAVSLIVAMTLLLGYGISRRLGLSRDLAWLLASGHAICGAAAVAAADQVLQAKDKEVTQAMTLVTLFGTVVMLLLPLLGACLDLGPEVYGFWVGGSVHEVAQALAAGFARGEACGEAASIIKLVRVAHLLPLGLLLLAVVVRRAGLGGGTRSKVVVPWFVVGFAAVAIVDAAGWVPERVASGLRPVCGYLMTVAMAALGLKSSLRDLATTGARALLAAALTTTGIVLAALLFALVCA